MKTAVRSRTIWAFVLAAAVTMPTAGAPSSCPGDLSIPLDLAIAGANVTVTGATPKGRILIVGYGRGWNAEEYATTFKRSLSLLKADDRGVLTVEGKATEDSVWTAIDVDAGRCGAVGMSSTASRRERLRNDALERRNEAFTGLTARLPLVQSIVIRPGRGVWELTAGDGGPEDEDHQQNGRTTVALNAMEALGASGPPPDQLQRGDVVLLFSPHQASMAFMRVEN